MKHFIRIRAKLQTKLCESVVGLGAEAILPSITTFAVPQRLDQRCDNHASVSVISSSLAYDLTILTVYLVAACVLDVAYNTSITRDNKWIMRKCDDYHTNGRKR